MKKYTLTSDQLSKCLAALSLGEACLADNGKGGRFLSRADIINKLQESREELTMIEFGG